MNGDDPSNPFAPRGKVAGGMLLSTLEELRGIVEQRTLGSPQRLQLARSYLESLEWGIKGLAVMGQRVGFFMLEEPAPKEFPKMLYRKDRYQIANNPLEEHTMNSEGFWPRAQQPSLQQEEPEPVTAPTFSIQLPGPRNGTQQDTEHSISEG